MITLQVHTVVRKVYLKRQFLGSHICARVTYKKVIYYLYLFRYKQHLPRAPDPVLSKLSPACHVGAVSEKFHSNLMKYIESNPDHCLTDEPDEHM